jgi:uncharacterized protein YbjT (DUF2867 family)
MSNPLILVTGATGKQGGAVLKHLLQQNFPVRALVRNLTAPAAKSLADRGVEIVQGDLDDQESLESAVAGAYGVFSVQAFYEADFDLEVRQGKLIAQVAKAAGVEHFVYSSVGSADKLTGVPHFDSKAKVEAHIKEIGIPATILRPVFLMENWEMFGRDSILNGTLMQPLNAETKLQQVSVNDVGAFAAMAFANRSEWIDRAVDIAGDEATMAETAAIFSFIIGRPVNYVQLPWEQFQQFSGEELTIMYRWLENVGYSADISARQKEYPTLTTFEQYLQNNNWVGAISTKS